jgi:hypothetical protein
VGVRGVGRRTIAFVSAQAVKAEDGLLELADLTSFLNKFIVAIMELVNIQPMESSVLKINLYRKNGIYKTIIYF